MCPFFEGLFFFPFPCLHFPKHVTCDVLEAGGRQDLKVMSELTVVLTVWNWEG